MAARKMPAAGTTFVERSGSRFQVFKNTFDALGA
jgi:hypothetical protein